MKITFVLPYAGLAGGIRVVAIYAERLRRKGHTVYVVSQPLRRFNIKQKVRSLAAGRGWPMVHEEPSYFSDLPVEHHVLECRRPVVDEDVPNADVVIATWWETAEWVSALSPEKGAKAYFIQHHEVFGSHPERVSATWRLPMHKITIAKWLVDLAANKYDDHFVSLVPNSVETQQFSCPARGKQSIPTVGLLYAIPPVKGCKVSLQAFALLQEQIPNVRLLTFGVQVPIHELSLPPGSEFTLRPLQSTLPTIYGRCDVWLCGSVAEGFHLPPLEAMACRCPVVSTRVGGSMEIIEEGVNGHIVEVNDVGALADRLFRMLTLSEESWRAMSDAAFSTAHRYTWDDATDLFERALTRTICRNQNGELIQSGCRVTI